MMADSDEEREKKREKFPRERMDFHYEPRRRSRDEYEDERERRRFLSPHGRREGGSPPAKRGRREGWSLPSEVMMGYGSPMGDPHHCQMMELLDVSRKFDSVFSLTKDTPVPLELKSLLHDNLKCRICLLLMTPPIIFAKCCKVILGCEACVNNWFQGADASTKSCPQCQAPQAFSETVRIYGLDDLLTRLRPLIGDEN